MTKNRLYCDENLEVLATMEKESVDLIYIDPPFFSNRKYEVIWADKITKKGAFLAFLLTKTELLWFLSVKSVSTCACESGYPC